MDFEMDRQWMPSGRPDGTPPAERLLIVCRQNTMPSVAAGQVLGRNGGFSVEPAMRGWVRAVVNDSDPVAQDGVMRSFTAPRRLA